MVRGRGNQRSGGRSRLAQQNGDLLGLWQVPGEQFRNKWLDIAHRGKLARVETVVEEYCRENGPLEKWQLEKIREHTDVKGLVQNVERFQSVFAALVLLDELLQYSQVERTVCKYFNVKQFSELQLGPFHEQPEVLRVFQISAHGPPRIVESATVANSIANLVGGDVASLQLLSEFFPLPQKPLLENETAAAACGGPVSAAFEAGAAPASASRASAARMRYRFDDSDAALPPSLAGCAVLCIPTVQKYHGSFFEVELCQCTGPVSAEVGWLRCSGTVEGGERIVSIDPNLSLAELYSQAVVVNTVTGVCSYLGETQRFITETDYEHRRPPPPQPPQISTGKRLWCAWWPARAAFVFVAENGKGKHSRELEPYALKKPGLSSTQDGAQTSFYPVIFFRKTAPGPAQAEIVLRPDRYENGLHMYAKKNAFKLRMSAAAASSMRYNCLAHQTHVLNIDDVYEITAGSIMLPLSRIRELGVRLSERAFIQTVQKIRDAKRALRSRTNNNAQLAQEAKKALEKQFQEKVAKREQELKAQIEQRLNLVANSDLIDTLVRKESLITACMSAVAGFPPASHTDFQHSLYAATGHGMPSSSRLLHELAHRNTNLVLPSDALGSPDQWSAYTLALCEAERKGAKFFAKQSDTMFRFAVRLALRHAALLDSVKDHIAYRALQTHQSYRGHAQRSAGERPPSACALAAACLVEAADATDHIQIHADGNLSGTLDRFFVKAHELWNSRLLALIANPSCPPQSLHFADLVADLLGFGCTASVFDVLARNDAVRALGRVILKALRSAHERPEDIGFGFAGGTVDAVVHDAAFLERTEKIVREVDEAIRSGGEVEDAVATISASCTEYADALRDVARHIRAVALVKRTDAPAICALLVDAVQRAARQNEYMSDGMRDGSDPAQPQTDADGDVRSVRDAEDTCERSSALGVAETAVCNVLRGAFGVRLSEENEHTTSIVADRINALARERNATGAANADDRGAPLTYLAPPSRTHVRTASETSRKHAFQELYAVLSAVPLLEDVREWTMWDARFASRLPDMDMLDALYLCTRAAAQDCDDELDNDVAVWVLPGGRAIRGTRTQGISIAAALKTALVEQSFRRAAALLCAIELNAEHTMLQQTATSTWGDWFANACVTSDEAARAALSTLYVVPSALVQTVAQPILRGLSRANKWSVAAFESAMLRVAASPSSAPKMQLVAALLKKHRKASERRTWHAAVVAEAAQHDVEVERARFQRDDDDGGGGGGAERAEDPARESDPQAGSRTPRDNGAGAARDASANAQDGEQPKTCAEDSRDDASACQTIIQDIRRKYGEDTEEEDETMQFLRAKIAKFVKRLSTELYADDVNIHYLMELIQNADDNAYDAQVTPSLAVHLHDGPDRACPRLDLFNNEIGFTSKHVQALCESESSKDASAGGYTGNKGIGFKSVFMLTWCPEIHSNGFHFQFRDEEDSLGKAVPTWCPPGSARCVAPDAAASLAQQREFKTSISLPLRECGAQAPARVAHDAWKRLRTADDVADQLAEVDPKLLLFLRRLRRFAIVDSTRGQAKAIARTTSESDPRIVSIRSTSWGAKLQYDDEEEEEDDDEVADVHVPSDPWDEHIARAWETGSNDDDSTRTEEFFVVQSQLDVPSHAREGFRKNCTHTDISVAFPLAGSSTFDSRDDTPKRPPTQKLYAYLPVQDSGLRFLINGDFELVTSREDLASPMSSAWNNWLLNELPRVLANAFCELVDFAHKRGLSHAWIASFVPIERDLPAGPIRNAARAMVVHLRAREWIACPGSGKLVAPKNVVLIPEHVTQPLYWHADDRTAADKQDGAAVQDTSTAQPNEAADGTESPADKDEETADSLAQDRGPLSTDLIAQVTGKHVLPEEKWFQSEVMDALAMHYLDQSHIRAMLEWAVETVDGSDAQDEQADEDARDQRHLASRLLSPSSVSRLIELTLHLARPSSAREVKFSDLPILTCSSGERSAGSPRLGSAVYLDDRNTTADDPMTKALLPLRDTALFVADAHFAFPSDAFTVKAKKGKEAKSRVKQQKEEWHERVRKAFTEVLGVCNNNVQHIALTALQRAKDGTLPSALLERPDIALGLAAVYFMVAIHRVSTSARDTREDDTIREAIPLVLADGTVVRASDLGSGAALALPVQLVRRARASPQENERPAFATVLPAVCSSVRFLTDKYADICPPQQERRVLALLQRVFGAVVLPARPSALDTAVTADAALLFPRALIEDWETRFAWSGHHAHVQATAGSDVDAEARCAWVDAWRELPCCAASVGERIAAPRDLLAPLADDTLAAVLPAVRTDRQLRTNEIEILAPLCRRGDADIDAVYALACLGFAVYCGAGAVRPSARANPRPSATVAFDVALAADLEHGSVFAGISLSWWSPEWWPAWCRAAQALTEAQAAALYRRASAAWSALESVHDATAASVARARVSAILAQTPTVLVRRDDTWLAVASHKCCEIDHMRGEAARRHGGVALKGDDSIRRSARGDNVEACRSLLADVGVLNKEIPMDDLFTTVEEIRKEHITTAPYAAVGESDGSAVVRELWRNLVSNIIPSQLRTHRAHEVREALRKYQVFPLANDTWGTLDEAEAYVDDSRMWSLLCELEQQNREKATRCILMFKDILERKDKGAPLVRGQTDEVKVRALDSLKQLGVPALSTHVQREANPYGGIFADGEPELWQRVISVAALIMGSWTAHEHPDLADEIARLEDTHHTIATCFNKLKVYGTKGLSVAYFTEVDHNRRIVGYETRACHLQDDRGTLYVVVEDSAADSQAPQHVHSRDLYTALASEFTRIFARAVDGVVAKEPAGNIGARIKRRRELGVWLEKKWAAALASVHNHREVRAPVGCGDLARLIVESHCLGDTFPILAEGLLWDVPSKEITDGRAAAVEDAAPVIDADAALAHVRRLHEESEAARQERGAAAAARRNASALLPAAPSVAPAGGADRSLAPPPPESAETELVSPLRGLSLSDAAPGPSRRSEGGAETSHEASGVAAREAQERAGEGATALQSPRGTDQNAPHQHSGAAASTANTQHAASRASVSAAFLENRSAQIPRSARAADGAGGHDASIMAEWTECAVEIADALSPRFPSTITSPSDISQWTGWLGEAIAVSYLCALFENSETGPRDNRCVTWLNESDESRKHHDIEVDLSSVSEELRTTLPFIVPKDATCLWIEVKSTKNAAVENTMYEISPLEAAEAVSCERAGKGTVYMVLHVVNVDLAARSGSVVVARNVPASFLDQIRFHCAQMYTTPIRERVHGLECVNGVTENTREGPADVKSSNSRASSQRGAQEDDPASRG